MTHRASQKVSSDRFRTFPSTEDRCITYRDSKVTTVIEGRLLEKQSPTKNFPFTVMKEESLEILSNIAYSIYSVIQFVRNYLPPFAHKSEPSEIEYDPSPQREDFLVQDKERQKEIISFCKKNISTFHDKAFTAKIAARALHPRHSVDMPGYGRLPINAVFDMARQSCCRPGTDPLHPLQERYAKIIELTFDSPEIAILALSKKYDHLSPERAAEIATMKYQRQQEGPMSIVKIKNKIIAPRT